MQPGYFTKYSNKLIIINYLLLIIITNNFNSIFALSSRSPHLEFLQFMSSVETQNENTEQVPESLQLETEMR